MGKKKVLLILFLLGVFMTTSGYGESKVLVNPIENISN